MFESWRNAGLMVKHSRHMFKIQECYQFINEHTAKRCLYCDLELGDALNVPVIEFLTHLKEKHPEKMESTKLEKWIKMFS